MRIDSRTVKFYRSLKFVRFPAIVFILLFSRYSSGQQTYTLSQCYDIAITNSPLLKSKFLEIMGSDIKIQQSKMQFFPNLNAGITHGYNWGQSIDPFTNTFATDRVRTNNLAVRSTWDLFAGLMHRYRLDLSKVSKQFAELTYELEKRNFKNEIAAVYGKLQTDHLIKSVCQEQFLLSKILLENVIAKEKAGRSTPFDRMRIEALIQEDSAALLKIENSIKYTEFVLKQFLNQSDSDKHAIKFEILGENQLKNQIKKFNDWHLDSLEEMRLMQLTQNTAAIQHNIFKAQLFPTLTLNSIVGSGYSGRNQELIGTTLVTKPMGEQLRENLYQTAVLSLNIPIFNAYQIKSEVKLAKIKIEQSALSLEQSTIQLINYIEGLIFEYENEQINTAANYTIYLTNLELFRASELMYLNGSINYADFATAKNKLTQSHLNYLLSLSKGYGILLILENLIG